MSFSATTNLSLPIIGSGTEAASWGDIVNNGLTSYLDIAIAGGLSVAITTTDVTLANTAGTSGTTGLTSTSAQYAILNISGAKTAARNLNLPVAGSKWYVINNASTSGTGGPFLLTVRGVTPTTGITLVDGEKAIVAWNGTDYVKVSGIGGVSAFTNASPGFTSTATAATTTTLTGNSTYFQRFTGTTTQTVVLPAGTAMAKGQGFIINNESTGNVTLQNGTPTTLGTIVSGMSLYVYCEDNSTTAGVWSTYLFVPGVGVSSAQVTWGTAGLSMGGQTITNAIWNGTPIGSSYGGTGSNGVYGFKNRVINGALNVRQYSGVSATGTGNVGAYVVDRWIGTANASTPSFTSAVASVTLPTSGVPQYALTITSTGAGSIGVAQRIESINLSDLNNQTVTVQVYLATSAAASVAWNAYYANTADTWQTVTSSSGIANLATSITSGTLATTSSLALYTFSFNIGANAPTNGLQIWFTTTAAASGTLTVTGLQLEKGSTATSFDYRSYQDELLLCNRYYGNYGGVLNTTALALTVATPRTAMRVNPTVVGLTFPAGSGGALTFSSYPSTTAFTGFGTAYQSSSHSATTQCAFALNAEL